MGCQSTQALLFNSGVVDVTFLLDFVGNVKIPPPSSNFWRVRPHAPARQNSHILEFSILLSSCLRKNPSVSEVNRLRAKVRCLLMVYIVGFEPT